MVVPPYPAPPGGAVTLTGRLRVDETDPQRRPAFAADGHRQVYAADSRPVAAATGLALEPGRLQLAADQPGVLAPVAVAPNTGAAPFTNFSYALQWLTFGAIALFALVYFVRLELLQRRGPQGPPGACPTVGGAPRAGRRGRPERSREARARRRRRVRLTGSDPAGGGRPS